ncbi:hypothetical protein ACFL0W_03805 [Nanoarchaeota archaeon]
MKTKRIFAIMLLFVLVFSTSASAFDLGDLGSLGEVLSSIGKISDNINKGAGYFYKSFQTKSAPPELSGAEIKCETSSKGYSAYSGDLTQETQKKYIGYDWKCILASEIEGDEEYILFKAVAKDKKERCVLTSDDKQRLEKDKKDPKNFEGWVCAALEKPERDCSYKETNFGSWFLPPGMAIEIFCIYDHVGGTDRWTINFKEIIAIFITCWIFWLAHLAIIRTTRLNIPGYFTKIMMGIISWLWGILPVIKIYRDDAVKKINAYIDDSAGQGSDEVVALFCIFSFLFPVIGFTRGIVGGTWWGWVIEVIITVKAFQLAADLIGKKIIGFRAPEEKEKRQEKKSQKGEIKKTLKTNLELLNDATKHIRPGFDAYVWNIEAGMPRDELEDARVHLKELIERQFLYDMLIATESTETELQKELKTLKEKDKEYRTSDFSEKVLSEVEAKREWLLGGKVSSKIKRFRKDRRRK